MSWTTSLSSSLNTFDSKTLLHLFDEKIQIIKKTSSNFDNSILMKFVSKSSWPEVFGSFFRFWISDSFGGKFFVACKMLFFYLILTLDHENQSGKISKLLNLMYLIITWETFWTEWAQNSGRCPENVNSSREGLRNCNEDTFISFSWANSWKYFEYFRGYNIL